MLCLTSRSNSEIESTRWRLLPAIALLLTFALAAPASAQDDPAENADAAEVEAAADAKKGSEEDAADEAAGDEAAGDAEAKAENEELKFDVREWVDQLDAPSLSKRKLAEKKIDRSRARGAAILA